MNGNERIEVVYLKQLPLIQINELLNTTILRGHAHASVNKYTSHKINGRLLRESVLSE